MFKAEMPQNSAGTSENPEKKVMGKLNPLYEVKDPEKELEKVPAELREAVRPYLTDRSEVEEFIPSNNSSGGGEVRIAYGNDKFKFKRLTLSFRRSSPDGAWEQEESIEVVNTYAEKLKAEVEKVWSEAGLSAEEQASLKALFGEAGIKEYQITQVIRKTEVQVVVCTEKEMLGGLMDRSGKVPSLPSFKDEYTFIKIGNTWVFTHGSPV